MDQVEQAGLLGFAHTTIVLSLTWFLCRWWRPLQSGNSSGVVRVATVIAIALTITAFLPVPSYSVHVARQVNRLLKAPTVTPDHSVADSTSSMIHAESVTTLFASAMRLVSADVDVKLENGSPGHKRWTFLLVAVVVLTSVLLVLRQLLGLFSLSSLRRKSQPINDGVVLSELAFFQRQLGCPRVELRVSEALYSAATAGWLRPVILLPADWATWSQDELRAVLAHELAHVKRRDFVWRLVGNLNASLHFYNPLAKWLRDRLVLDQELAADDLASCVLGSNRAYAKALSSLAMRIDRAHHSIPCPGLLSVSSSYLLRRIEMLRAKEGSQARSRSRLSVRVGVGLIVSAAVVTVGLRVSADNALPISATKTSVTIPRFDPAQLPFTQQGAFVVRPSALVTTSEMKPYAATIQQFWSRLIKDAKLPAIALDEVEFLAGGLDVNIRPLDPREKQVSAHRWSVGASSSLLVLRTHKPQDFAAHIAKMFPAAEEESSTNGTLFLLPRIPSLGPERALLRILDERTLAWSCWQVGKEWIRNNTSLPAAKKEWSSEWESVDGGVFTLLVNRDAIEWPESRSEWPSSVNQLIDQTRFLGVGVMPDSGIRLTCEVTGAGNASRRQISTSIESLTAEISASLESPAAEGETDVEVHPVNEFLGTWLRSALLTSPQRTHPTVRVSGPMIKFVTNEENQVTRNSISPTDTDGGSSAVMLHFQLVEIYVDKAKQLGLDFQVAGPKGVSALKVEFGKGARHLVETLVQNPKVAMSVIDALRSHGLAKTLAEPVITTASGRPARFRMESEIHEIDLEVVPQVVGKGRQISLSVRLAKTKEWKKVETIVKASAGETVLVPLHNTKDQPIRRFLIVRPEMVELAALRKLQPTKTPPGKLLRR